MLAYSCFAATSSPHEASDSMSLSSRSLLTPKPFAPPTLSIAWAPMLRTEFAGCWRLRWTRSASARMRRPMATTSTASTTCPRARSYSWGPPTSRWGLSTWGACARRPCCGTQPPSARQRRRCGGSAMRPRPTASPRLWWWPSCCSAVEPCPAGGSAYVFSFCMNRTVDRGTAEKAPVLCPPGVYVHYSLFLLTGSVCRFRNFFLNNKYNNARVGLLKWCALTLLRPIFLSLPLSPLSPLSPCKVWYSSTWTRACQHSFRLAIAQLMAKGAGEGGPAETRPIPAPALKFLRHWQLHDVSLSKSRRLWLESIGKKGSPIADLRRKVGSGGYMCRMGGGVHVGIEATIMFWIVCANSMR